MSILIDMEMPKEGFVEILIRDDGTVQQTGKSYRIDGTDYYTPYVGEMPTVYKAVSVQPHGRLIDADALAEHKFVCIPHVSINGKDAGTAYRLGWNTAIEAVMENAETIIGGE